MADSSTFTSGRHIHKIIEKDTDRLLGLCSRCGVVKLRITKKKTAKKTYIIYRCEIAYKENVQTQYQRRFGVKSHGLTELEAREFIGNKVCNICLAEDKLHVDHDHNTGKLRGALCSNHNTGLGLFGDDPELLRRAADYLEGKLPVARHNKPTGDRWLPASHGWNDVML